MKSKKTKKSYKRKINKKAITRITCVSIISILILCIGIICIFKNINNSKTVSSDIKIQDKPENNSLMNVELPSDTNTTDENSIDENTINSENTVSSQNTSNNSGNSGKTNNNKSNTPKYYIKVNNTANVVTIYTKDSSGNYTVPFKAMVCSTGTATPQSGKYSLNGRRYIWHTLFGHTPGTYVYGQYATNIDGRNILFHSVPYTTKNDPTSLEYLEYDKLGTKASAGCIRLTVQDAKWIYNNISSGTTVEFYKDSNPGPLGKPSAAKISQYSSPYKNWDPTDSNPSNPWKNGSPNNNNNNNSSNSSNPNINNNNQNNSIVNNTSSSENNNNTNSSNTHNTTSNNISSTEKDDLSSNVTNENTSVGNNTI